MPEKRLKIAIFGSHFPPSGGGGVTTSHVNLFHALRGRGHEVRFFTFLDSDSVKEKPRTDVIRNGAPWVLRYLIRAVCRVVFKLLEKCEMAYQTSDILESWWGARKASAAVQKFDPDWIILPDHCGPALYLKKPTRAKTIWVSHHNPLRFIHQPYIPAHSVRDARFSSALENRALKKIDVAVCPSQYMMKEFKQVYPFSGPLHEIPNLIDIHLMHSIEPGDIRHKLGLRDSDPLVYVPGAGSAFKGKTFVAEIVSEIAAHFKDQPIGFYLAGAIPPDLKGELQDTPKNAKLYDQEQLPYLEHLRNVKCCNLGVSPTIVESYGMAILEAQCLGIPMVVFARQATPEVIQEGKNGYLTPAFDIDQIVDKSIAVLKNPIPLNPFLGEDLLKAQSTSVDLWEKILSS